MLTYRFYRLDSDGHITGPPTVAELLDDRAAVEAGEAFLDGKAIEIWQLTRMVVRLQPKRPGS